MNIQKSPLAAGSDDLADRSPWTSKVAMVLACASISLWFWVAFPWQHHNESLVWATSFAKMSFWQSITSNQIPSVQNFRPLGVGLAWVTFQVSSGGVWLQQLVNFVLTVLAWALASTCCVNRLTFGWLSFICAGAFFSGYIYLFHLHGVFYPPLLLFIAVLLVHQSHAPALGWRTTAVLLAVAVATAGFHPFALLIFGAYVAGLWLECRISRRPARLDAAAVSLIAATALAAVLVVPALRAGAGNPLEGLLTSYRALEVNRIGSLVAVVLAAATGSSLGRTWRERAAGGTLSALCALGLMAAGLPAIGAWIATCLIVALRNRRIALAAVLFASAAFPIATGSGSPTYALFSAMPCIAAIADGLPLPGSTALQRGLATTTIVATLALLLVLRAGAVLPLVTRIVGPLRAEQEKTTQMMSAFAWLDKHPEVGGRLQLCSAAVAPTASNGALDRKYRAPTGTWVLDQYVKDRFGARLTTGRPLGLCFGGQALSDVEVLLSVPGRWAGLASIVRPSAGTSTVGSR